MQEGLFLDVELLRRVALNPGTRPATSQLDRLISITAISLFVLLEGDEDRLKSFGYAMGA